MRELPWRDGISGRDLRHPLHRIIDIMGFELKDVLTAIGPAAAIVFASWIFMGFLQQRYDAAYDRYRSLIEDKRRGDISDTRTGNIRQEVALYKQRCDLMNQATRLGSIAAMLLIGTVIVGALGVVFPGFAPFKYLGLGAALLGLGLVIIAPAS